MKFDMGSSNSPWIGIGTLMLLFIVPSAMGQKMRFFPIRSAPLGSPPGTIGEPVTPVLNNTLGCWELTLPGGIEVHLDVQPSGWGDAPGSPTLGAIQATVVSTGYSNGLGGDLVPKGWPETPNDGIFYTLDACTGNGDTCNFPFDLTCGGGANGTCQSNPDWVMPPCTNNLPCFATPTLDYSWASAIQVDCNVDDGEVKTMGGLILNVPPDAAGTYVIALDPDPNNSFMINGQGNPIPGLVLTPACITISTGACCTDSNADGQQDSCENDTTEFDCTAAGGSFAGDGITCSGQVGACCFDGDRDGVEDTCTVMDGNCCFAKGGTLLDPGSSCDSDIGACCMDDNDDDLYSTCVEIARQCCEATGWLFLGIGTKCRDIINVCTEDGYGICYVDTDDDGFLDTCAMITPSACHALGGTFRGFGTACGDIGACCMDSNGDQLIGDPCADIDQIACDAQGGAFQGVGTSCLGDQDGNGTDDACRNEIPAVSAWGLMIMALLLLVGIKVRFGRRQVIEVPGTVSYMPLQ